MHHCLSLALTADYQSTKTAQNGGFAVIETPVIEVRTDWLS